MKKLFLAMMACAGLCACSSDDIDLGSTQKVFEGDKAYIAVQISDVGTSTRGTQGSSFISGTSTEETFSNIRFYFYDDDGNYVTEGEIDTNENDGTSISVDNDNNQYEWQSNALVVLEGLTGKTYPTYMVTVMNVPTNFKAGRTLGTMEKLTSNTTPAYKDESGNFIMTSSSYYVDGRSYDFVSKLEDKNFLTEPIKTSEIDANNAVMAYVERLAAKVTVDIAGEDNNYTFGGTWISHGNKIFRISQSVATDPDDVYEPNSDRAAYDEAAKYLYVKLENWRLDATTHTSYMFKNINDQWSEATDGTGLGFTWNAPTYHRSYWAESYNYGSAYQSDYDYFDLSTATDENPLHTAFNGSVVTYCAENTNTADVLGNKNSECITNVLIKAHVYKDRDCETPAELVRYNGVLYDLDYFCGSMARNANVFKDENGTLCSSSDFTIGTTKNEKGQITITFNPSGNTYYEEVTDAEGNITYTAISGTPTVGDHDVIYYKNGLMYYLIPIEHLNNYTTNGSGVSENNLDGTLQEANYGIVRNHYYKVVITDIEDLGHGAISETDDIIPDGGDDSLEDAKYYVGSIIEILSWNEVSQGAAL